MALYYKKYSLFDIFKEKQEGIENIYINKWINNKNWSLLWMVNIITVKNKDYQH